MWQVITSSQPFQTFADSDRGLFSSEIDDLLNALAALQAIPAPQPRQLLPCKPKKGGATAVAAARASEVIGNEVISAVEMPRQVNAPKPASLSCEMREALLGLRATIMLAAEKDGLRSILLCGADAQASTTIAVHLSQLLAEYERLKVACLEVSAEPAPSVARHKVLPIGYTFQLRRTRQTNLYEIASSLGVVRLDDWLRWWNPNIVLQEMRKVFDLVVIQAPPISTNPEVALLAAAVDGVIVVATENVTPYASLEATTKRLRAAQARILGVTLTPAAAAPSTFSNVKTRMRELLNALAKSK